MCLHTEAVRRAIFVKVRNEAAHRDTGEVLDEISQGHPELAIILVTVWYRVAG